MRRVEVFFFSERLTITHLVRCRLRKKHARRNEGLGGLQGEKWAVEEEFHKHEACGTVEVGGKFPTCNGGKGQRPRENPPKPLRLDFDRSHKGGWLFWGARGQHWAWLGESWRDCVAVTLGVLGGGWQLALGALRSGEGANREGLFGLFCFVTVTSPSSQSQPRSSCSRGGAAGPDRQRGRMEEMCEAVSDDGKRLNCSTHGRMYENFEKRWTV